MLLFILIIILSSCQKSTNYEVKIATCKYEVTFHNKIKDTLNITCSDKANFYLSPTGFWHSGPTELYISDLYSDVKINGININRIPNVCYFKKL